MTYIEADSPEEAIDKARDEIEDALSSGDFQLSEIEANEKVVISMPSKDSKYPMRKLN